MCLWELGWVNTEHTYEYKANTARKEPEGRNETKVN